MTFNEEDVKKTYRLLSHKNETEIRMIDPTRAKKPISIFVHNEQEFINTCKKYNGEYNIYAGINERKAGGTRKEDVLSIKTFVVDIDAKREKGEAATSSELNKAREVVKKILDKLEEDKFKVSGIMMSGNGYQLWFSMAPIEIYDDNREILNEKTQHIQKWFQTFADKDASVDNIGDLPRIIKIAGTTSIKGSNTEERPHRVAYWEYYEPHKCDIIRNKILNAKLEVSSEIVKTNTPKERDKYYDRDKLNNLLSSNEKLRELYAGKGDEWGYDSKSESEFALIMMLLRGGFDKNEVWGAMNDALTEKWGKTGDAYKNYTLNKAEKYVAKSVKSNEKKEMLLPELNDDITQTFSNAFNLDKKKALWDVSERIINDLNIKTIIETEPRPTIYYYNGGSYKPKAEGKIMKRTREIGGEIITRADLGEVSSYVKTNSYVSEDDFDTDLNLISVNNGILDIMTGELTPHDPKYLIRVKLNTDYDKEATCPRWEKFLEEVVVPNGGEPDDEHLAKIATLQEIAGYCLYRANPLHKAIMLTGEGANGKSVFLETLIKLLDPENVSTVPLQAFDSREYALGAMVTKLANIHSDLSDRALKESGNFKMVVSGDRVFVNQKYKDPLSTNVYAKLLFSANKVPETSDNTPAFFRRWIIINFPNTFDDDTADKQLIEKLEKEIPGVLNWALEGLKRLLHNQRFSYAPSVDEMELLYISLSSPVDAFVLECLDQTSGGVVPKYYMYSAFVKYAKEKKMPIMTDNAFARKLKVVAEGLSDQKRKLGDDKKQTTCWVGWNLNAEWDKKCGGYQGNHCILPKTSIHFPIKQHKENNPDNPDISDISFEGSKSEPEQDDDDNFIEKEIEM